MKKFLALIVACVTVASSVAATVYSSKAFLGDEEADLLGAAPVLMKGTLKTNDWTMGEGDICALVKSKSTYQVFLAFCQPCINCVSCAEEVDLYNATMYIVEKNTKAKKVFITVVPFEDLAAEVTTGKAGQSSKKGDVVMELDELPTHNKYGVINDIILFGGWNQKTWFTGNDTNSGNAKVKAVMGIIQKLDGSVTSYYADDIVPLWASGNMALRRDDSFTKKLMMAMTTDTKGAVSNPFLNCGTPEINLNSCYDVLTSNGEDADADGILDEADTSEMQTMVENYIVKKMVPKSYEYSISGNRNMDDTWINSGE